jgi:DNA-directed RNA polymerase specialized sigma24 family protein
VETLTIEGLMAQYGRLVTGYIARRVPRREIKDISQTVWMNAFIGLPGLQDPMAVRPWLLKIAKRAIAEYYRSGRVEDSPIAKDTPTLSDFDGLLEVKEVLARLYTLSPLQSVPLLMYAMGWHTKEMERILRRRHNAIEVSMWRARKRLGER